MKLVVKKARQPLKCLLASVALLHLLYVSALYAQAPGTRPPAAPGQLAFDPNPGSTDPDPAPIILLSSGMSLIAFGIAGLLWTRTKTVRIRLVDQDGRGIPNEPFELILPSGKTMAGLTDATGSASLNYSLKITHSQGDCSVNFSRLDRTEWAAPVAQTLPDVFTEYEIQENEWLLRIAHKAEFGFRTERPIVDANPDLIQESAGNTNVLPTGRRIKIPAKRTLAAPALVGKQNTYLAVFTPERIQIALKGNQPFSSDYDSHRDNYAGCEVKLRINGVEKDQSQSSTGSLVLHPSLSVDLPKNVEKAELIVAPKAPVGRQAPWSYEVANLNLGGLDPLTGPGAVKALQKILTNLGYYRTAITGALDEATVLAIRAFQQVENIHTRDLTDEATTSALAAATGITMAHSAFEWERAAAGPKDVPVLRGHEAGARNSVVVHYNSTYNEPSGSSRTSVQPVYKFQWLPPQFYVAPNTVDTAACNVIRPIARRFIFLDTGRWMKESRDFSLVYGRHVYLCSYHADRVGQSGVATSPSDLNLDSIFFDGMGSRVEVVSRASAVWASENDFNWDVLTIVVPDLHLLTDETERAWRMQDYSLAAEIDLLHFAEHVTEIKTLAGKLRFVQIGDSYDLWVNRKPCLFRANDTHTVELKSREELNLRPDDAGPVSILRSWIHEIQGNVGPKVRPVAGRFDTYQTTSSNWVKDVFDRRLMNGMDSKQDYFHYTAQLHVPHQYDPSYQMWLNPAEKAMRMLEAFCARARDGVVYIWGNHDNYLALKEVCAEAGLVERRLCFEDKGVYIEHAHRLEACLGRPDSTPTWAGPPDDRSAQLCPHNYDGDPSGYEMIDVVFDARVTAGDLGIVAGAGDDFSRFLDENGGQSSYWSEFARLRMGRETRGEPIPHIFIIGHTHRPRLEYIDIG